MSPRTTIGPNPTDRGRPGCAGATSPPAPAARRSASRLERREPPRRARCSPPGSMRSRACAAAAGAPGIGRASSTRTRPATTAAAAAWVPRPLDHAPHRAPRRRALRPARPVPLGGGAHLGLARPLPSPRYPLRAARRHPLGLHLARLLPRLPQPDQAVLLEALIPASLWRELLDPRVGAGGSEPVRLGEEAHSGLASRASMVASLEGRRRGERKRSRRQSRTRSTGLSSGLEEGRRARRRRARRGHASGADRRRRGARGIGKLSGGQFPRRAPRGRPAGATPRRGRGRPGTRFGVEGGQHEGDVLARGGPDRREDAGPQVAERPDAGRALGPRRHQRWRTRPLVPTRAFAGKTVHWTVLRPGSLLEPPLDPLARVAGGDRGYPLGRAPFLKACLAPGHRAEAGAAAPASAREAEPPEPLGQARGMTGPAEAPLEPAAGIGPPPGAGRRPRRDRGRARHAAASSASSGASRRGGRPLGRPRSPARPSALQRSAASRSAWRSRPARRAASARLRPSSA